MTRPSCEFQFHGELNDFLPPDDAGKPVAYAFDGHPAVKDAIEALGVPHTEVDLVIANGRSVDFRHSLQAGDAIEVFPASARPDAPGLIHLIPPPPDEPRFTCDTHLGKLARRLRLLGFDVVYGNRTLDADIAAGAAAENRIILTRDRGLLKRKSVQWGCFVRSGRVAEQVLQVVDRYRLRDRVRPYSRCAACNGLVDPVAKREVEAELPPRTRRHVDTFFRCRDCAAFYWRGAHAKRLDAWMAEVAGGACSRGGGAPAPT